MEHNGKFMIGLTTALLAGLVPLAGRAQSPVPQPTLGPPTAAAPQPTDPGQPLPPPQSLEPAPPAPADRQPACLPLPPTEPTDVRLPINLAAALRLADARPLVVAAAQAR